MKTSMNRRQSLAPLAALFGIVTAATTVAVEATAPPKFQPYQWRDTISGKLVWIYEDGPLFAGGATVTTAHADWARAPHLRHEGAENRVAGKG